MRSKPQTPCWQCSEPLRRPTMHNAERYPYTAIDSALGEAGLAPYVPLRLTYQGREVPVGGLLDTGATVNVLPSPVDMELGALAAGLLPPAVRDATLRERGDQMMHARYDPLRPGAVALREASTQPSRLW